MKKIKDPTVPALMCNASALTKGRVPCNRDVYARGLCKAHYGQMARNPFTVGRRPRGQAWNVEAIRALKPIGGHPGDLVQLPGPVRVPMMVADTLHEVATERQTSTYELERFIIEEWVAKKKLEKSTKI